MGRIIKGQILATTNEVGGVRIPVETLRRFAQDFDHVQAGTAHDLSAPPACRAFNARVEPMPSGEHALVADVEVLDEQVYAGFGGFSLAFTGPGVRFGDGPVALRVLVDPELFDYADAVRRIGALQREEGIEVFAYFQHGLKLKKTILTLVVGAGGAFGVGFFGAAGQAAFDALRDLKPTEAESQLEIHLRVERPGQPLIIMPVDLQCPAERLGAIDVGRVDQQIEVKAQGQGVIRSVVSVDAAGNPTVETIVGADGRVIE